MSLPIGSCLSGSSSSSSFVEIKVHFLEPTFVPDLDVVPFPVAQHWWEFLRRRCRRHHHRHHLSALLHGREVDPPALAQILHLPCRRDHLWK